MTLITAGTAQAQITTAIRNAARKTGVDFDYLWHTALRESSLNPQAKSTSSSAAGLFQFVEQTWLSLVKSHGADIGLGELAGDIRTSNGGRHFVPDGRKRSEILALRYDPKVSSYLAGKLTQESKSILETELGRQANGDDLYLAHFFGPARAADFLKLKQNAPHTNAALYFGKEASANRSLFYDEDGSARSISDVYDRLTANKETPPPVDAEPAAETVPAIADADNFHHTLFTSGSRDAPVALRQTVAPHFILSPGVVKALTDLKLPTVPGRTEDGLRKGSDMHRLFDPIDSETSSLT